ncbi:regulator of chromosome condensation-like isoform X3 [Haemaphysalis longicornis]
MEEQSKNRFSSMLKVWLRNVKSSATQFQMAPRTQKRKAAVDLETGPSAARSTKKEKGATPVVVERRQAVGQVYVVGQGDVGQLGLGPDVLEKARFTPIPVLDNIVDVTSGGMHTLCLTADGQVFSFGCNDEGALGRPTSSLEPTSESTPALVKLPEPIAQLSAGDSHSAALAVSGTVYMWGNFRDSTGQVGLVTEGSAAQEPKKVATNIVQIASGSDHVAMLTAEGDILTMGCPEQGQLGRIGSYFAARGSRRPVSVLITPTKVPMPRTKAGSWSPEGSTTACCSAKRARSSLWDAKNTAGWVSALRLQLRTRTSRHPLESPVWLAARMSHVARLPHTPSMGKVAFSHGG